MKTLKICLCVLCLLPFRAVGKPQDSGATFYMAYKILPGFEKYVIFHDGRIWSRSKHCFMSNKPNTDGYPSNNFIRIKAKDGYRGSMTFHIIIATAFVPNPNGYKEVNHKDGIKKNIHYLNLEWCTRSYNVKHTYRLGLRSQKGENNGNYKNGKYTKE